MRDNLNVVFAELQKSDFRRKFHLNPKDASYLREKGLEEIAQHASKFVSERLAPAEPKRDGKQTPYRGHPVFVAQHATATCCRSCLLKWHHIPQKIELSEEQRSYVVSVLMKWLREECVDVQT